MKNLIAVCLLIIAAAVSGFAQSKDEQEITKFIAAYDQSYINQDISFLENNLADNYTVADSYGTVKNRAQAIEEAKKEKAAPTEKMISFKSVNDSVRVAGEMAVVSGSWVWSGAAPNSPQSSEPHSDKGRFLMVLEKRGGKWMLVAEQYSEALHDKKIMEQQVLKISLEYGEMIKRGDPAEIERILADEYLYTNERGKVRNKTEDIERYKTGKTKITFVEISDQKVRVIGNNTAVETGTFHVKGTDKDGKSFDEIERFTSVWVWRNLRWQVVGDHSSTIAK